MATLPEFAVVLAAIVGAREFIHAIGPLATGVAAIGVSLFSGYPHTWSSRCSSSLAGILDQGTRPLVMARGIEIHLGVGHVCRSVATPPHSGQLVQPANISNPLPCQLGTSVAANDFKEGAMFWSLDDSNVEPNHAAEQRGIVSDGGNTCRDGVYL